MWSEAADAIGHFQQTEGARADRWRLVRYEDLVDDPEGQLRRLFEFLALNPATYDFKAARDLPVRGSSAFGREGRDVHWELVAKDASFAPKERWRSWRAEQLDRFQWLAGDQLRHLGYSEQVSRRSVAHSIKHVLLDWQWSAARSARLRLGTISRPLRRRLGLLREP
jgi:hypothetical protein